MNATMQVSILKDKATSRLLTCHLKVNWKGFMSLSSADHVINATLICEDWVQHSMYYMNKRLINVETKYSNLEKYVCVYL